MGDPQPQEVAKNILLEAYRDQTHHETLYPWIWMSTHDIRAMVRAIASMAEKSYRRGIQQDERPWVSSEDAAWFRYGAFAVDEEGKTFL